MLKRPYAEFASLSWRERIELATSHKKFCGRLQPHLAHGWVCARTQVRCEGLTPRDQRDIDDPIALVEALARGKYAPRLKREDT